MAQSGGQVLIGMSLPPRSDRLLMTSYGALVFDSYICMYIYIYRIGLIMFISLRPVWGLLLRRNCLLRICEILCFVCGFDE